MKIVPTQQSNALLPQLNKAPAFVLKEKQPISENGGMREVTVIITAWMPDKADIKAINAGRPIIMQVYKDMPITALFTLGEDGKPNI